MGGFVIVVITIFVIWFLGMVMAEKPGDEGKQDVWHRFKKRFRAGRIYHLFAARTKQRLFGELFVFYMLGGLSLLFALDMFVTEINRQFVSLDQMQKVQGTLVQFIPAKNDCRHGIVIQTRQVSNRYQVCVGDGGYARLTKVIGKEVTAWVTQGGTLFDNTNNSVNQLQYGDEVVIKHHIGNREDFNLTKQHAWVYLILIPFVFSIAFFRQIAVFNISKYGRWQQSKKEI